MGFLVSGFSCLLQVFLKCMIQDLDWREEGFRVSG